jgi:hypothetical protein
LQEANLGDTTTVQETLAEAGTTVAELMERETDPQPLEKPKVNPGGIEEVVADKGITADRHCNRCRGAHVYSREEAGRETALGGERKATGSSLCESAAVAAAEGQADSEETWRTDRADLRSLLRHGRHAANASAKTQQHSQTTVDPLQTTVDPRRRNESGAAVAEHAWNRNAARAPRAPACPAFSCCSDCAGRQFKKSAVCRRGSNLGAPCTASISSPTLSAFLALRNPKTNFNPGLPECASLLIDQGLSGGWPQPVTAYQAHGTDAAEAGLRASADWVCCW